MLNDGVATPPGSRKFLGLSAQRQRLFVNLEPVLGEHSTRFPIKFPIKEGQRLSAKCPNSSPLLQRRRGRRGAFVVDLAFIRGLCSGSAPSPPLRWAHLDTATLGAPASLSARCDLARF